MNATDTPKSISRNRQVRRVAWWKYPLLFPAALLTRLWLMSLRIRIMPDSPLTLAEFGTMPGGRIYVFWHNRIFIAAELKRRFSPGYKMNGLVSASRDGSWLTAFLDMIKVNAVRGSSSWRGGPAMLELTRKLDAGEDAAITPDGPRGPCYSMKSGPVLLAHKTGRPIILVHSRFSRGKRLASWDGFYLPRPFSQVNVWLERVNVGDPEFKLPAAELAALLKEKLLARTDDSGFHWSPKRKQ